jgi:hypothetical protein
MAKQNREESDLDYTRFAAENAEDAKKVEKAEAAAPWKEPEAPNKTFLIILTLLAVAVMGAIVIGYLTWVSDLPEAFLISVPIEDYSESWPVNPWAYDDSKLLAECFQKNKTSGISNIATIANQNQNSEKLRTLLKWIGGDKVDDSALKDDLTTRPIVLHISALGAVVRDPSDGSDVPFIIPIDGDRADPWDWKKGSDPKWIKVQEVLDALEKCKAKKKLLLLDLSHPCHNGFLGPVRNDLSERLHKMLEKLEKENKLKFPVIVSTGSNQFSWPSDVDQCSAFAYYLAEGLRGKADGYEQEIGKDQRINVRELAKFVTPRVARFTKSVFNKNQTPTAYGLDTEAARFVITLSGLPRREVPAPRDPYPDMLTTWWLAREVAPALNLHHPLRLQRLTGALLRREEYWQRASNATLDRARSEFQEKAADYWREKTFAGTLVANPYAKSQKDLLEKVSEYRLSLPTGLPEPKDAKEPKGPVVDPYLKALSSKSLKEEEREKLKQAWDDRVAASPKSAGADLWDHARKTIWTEGLAEQFAKVGKQITNPPSGQPGFITFELLLLQRFDRWKIRSERQLEQFPGQDIQQLLDLEQELSKLLKFGPEGFAVVKQELEQAETFRNEAHQGYFKPGRGALQILDSIQKAKAKYSRIAVVLDKWRKANQILRELLAVIHDTQPGVANSLEPSLNDWVAAISTAVQLSNLVSAADQGTFDADQVDNLTLTARLNIDTLRKGGAEDVIKNTLKNLTGRQSPDQVEKMFRLVVNTSGAASTRKLVWEESRNEYAKLVEELRKSDTADDEAKPWRLSPLPQPVANSSEIGAVSHRTKVAEQMLELAGLSGLEDFKATAQQCKTELTSLEPMEKYGRASDLIWFDKLKEEAKGFAAANRHQRVLRILRSLPVDVLRSPKASAAWFDIPDPMAMIVKQDNAIYAKFVHSIIVNDRANGIGEEKLDVGIAAYFEQRLATMTRVSDP